MDKGFFQRVYEMVQQIPPGYVASYGQIARLIGEPRKARFVGFALHDNPDNSITPCHRVVFKDGRLAPGFAFGGPEVQKQILLDEGVQFRDADHVDMEKCSWLGE